jgi:glycosyltransferase involved in cell wall biosynthesis
MKYKVAIYCPDQHLQYDLHTLDHQGVGGGVTARIRMAHALADLGHQVTAYINCPREATIQDVRYRHYNGVDHFTEEIFIASTSGGGLDLSSLAGKKIDAKIKILMVHGVEFPRNIEPVFFDAIYALSNFVRQIAITQWQVDPAKLFVTYRGVVEENFKPGKRLKRDPYQLVYFGHPSKGLDAAIAALRILRQADDRYTLHVFGGQRLWGGEEQALPQEPGLIDHGLVGQRHLARKLMEMSFSLNLQAREEPFGMVVTESMKAGCIVLASPVGAFPEIVCHGFNGLLVPGRHTEPETHALAAKWIEELNRHADYGAYLRQNAIATPLSWNMLAQAWTGHWDWLLGKGASGLGRHEAFLGWCSLCNGNWLALRDGLHCTGCGQYRRAIP